MANCFVDLTLLQSENACLSELEIGYHKSIERRLPPVDHINRHLLLSLPMSTLLIFYDYTDG